MPADNPLCVGRTVFGMAKQKLEILAKESLQNVFKKVVAHFGETLTKVAIRCTLRRMVPCRVILRLVHWQALRG